MQITRKAGQCKGGSLEFLHKRLKGITLMSIKTNKTNKINEKRKRENKLKSQLISEKDNFYKSKIRVVKSLYIFDIIISCS